MASDCKDHDHSKQKKSMFSDRLVYFFNLVHLISSYLLTYNVSLYYSYTRPSDYPEFHYEFHISLFTLLFLPCLVSLVLSNLTSPGGSPDTDRLDYETCERCHINRIYRSHHCSKCDYCILRMDHHCVWVNNCIGLYNHKLFFWYTFYMTFGGLHHLYLYFSYSFSDYPAVYSSFIIKFLIFYLSCINVLFIYFCATLLNTQIRLIISGNSNIEYMKEMGTSLRFLVFGFFDVKSKYDSGLFNNFLQVFGTDVLLWLIPVPADNHLFCDGSPEVPKPSNEVIQEFKVKYDLD